jgi:hypothetical protein
MLENPSFTIEVHQIISCMPNGYLVSTSVDPTSTSVNSTSVNVVYVNHTSYSHCVDVKFIIPYSTISYGRVVICKLSWIFHWNSLSQQM